MKLIKVCWCGASIGVSVVVTVCCVLLLCGWRCGVVQSSSMVPSIDVGDILVWNVDNRLMVGDVVVYGINDRLIAHRVVSVGDNYVVSKGDSKYSDFQVIEFEDIVGKVICWCSAGVLVFCGVGMCLAFAVLYCTIYLLVKFKTIYATKVRRE